jgi:hypothetical protein
MALRATKGDENVRISAPPAVGFLPPVHLAARKHRRQDQEALPERFQGSDLSLYFANANEFLFSIVVDFPPCRST